MEQTRDRVGTIFFQAPHHARVCFDLRSARARLKNIKRKKNSSVLHAIFEKENHRYS